MVPASADELPYAWVTGPDVDAFEDAADCDARTDLTRLTAVSDSRLYGVSWTEVPPLLDALTACGGVMLEVHRVWTLTDESERDARYGLTPEQREAVTLAFDRGYFETPRDTTLSALADELGISQQALSDRVRRANEKILRRVLRPAAVDGREAGPAHSTDRSDSA